MYTIGGFILCSPKRVICIICIFTKAKEEKKNCTARVLCRFHVRKSYFSIFYEVVYVIFNSGSQ